MDIDMDMDTITSTLIITATDMVILQMMKSHNFI